MALHGLILLFCEINCGVPPPLSRPRQRLVNRDPRQPRRKLGSPIELPEVKVGVDVCLLHDVFRLILVFHDRTRGPVDPLVVAPHQDFIESGLSVEDPRDDVFVAEGGPPVEHCSTYYVHTCIESGLLER
jgi:hypothetical protein